MKIYVLRHGETDYNAEGRFQGQVNTKLNENGINQAKHTKNKLKAIEFDVVISSPLGRAIETAKIVTNIEPVIDDRIIERSFGKLEGKHSISDYEDKKEEYNIETYEGLCNRVYEFLDETIKKYIDKENVLIATHECIAQIIETYFNKKQKKENWKEYRLKTGDYKEYEIGG